MVSPEARPLYSAAQLEPLLNPRSIAIYGASERTESFGFRTFQNLKDSGRQVYLINKKYKEIDGHPCYASIALLPQTPDCVVVAVPQPHVEAVLEECAASGVGGAIVYASGFAETGLPERIELQNRISAIARSRNMPILGPNCIGIISDGGLARISFASTPDLQPKPYPAIGIVSQSGGLGFALSQSSAHGFHVSHVLTAGNACDVDVADEIAYLAEQSTCQAIVCVFEGMDAPSRLLEAGELAMRRGKPVIMFKIASGVEGAQAAMSHTGSLAGSHEAYLAAFKRAGFVVVDTFEALMETAAFFAKAGRPASYGVAALATSGGSAIMVADSAEKHNVPLPQPAPHVRKILEEKIPEFGSARNPCDVTAQILNDPGALPACADAFLSSDDFGALVFPHAYAYAPGTARLPILGEVAANNKKILCCVWLTQWLDGPGADIVEANPHIALFRSMDRCMATLAAWHSLERRRRERESTLEVIDEITPDKHGVAELLQQARNTILTESQAKLVLSKYGIPTVTEELASAVDEGLAIARSIGFPVVLKVESPDIAHKTEAGVVRLNIKDEVEFRSAWEAILANARSYNAAAHINGVIVQRMVPQGLELLIGARHDSTFGPLIVVGMGGILVELMNDTAVDLAPVTPSEAGRLLKDLKGSALLDGFRGMEAADVDLLAKIVSRVSQLVHDHRNLIDELDINPVIVRGSDVVAVDALISLRQPAQF